MPHLGQWYVNLFIAHKSIKDHMLGWLIRQINGLMIFSVNMVAKYYFQQRSMESNRTRRYKSRNNKKKIKMDWSHIKKRGWRDTEGCPNL
jgi:hypothetical protein